MLVGYGRTAEELLIRLLSCVRVKVRSRRGDQQGPRLGEQTNMTSWRKIRGLGLAALTSVVVLGSGQSFADFENALETYREAADSNVRANAVIGAMDLWQKSALAGDVRSAKILGDLYSHQDIDPSSTLDMAPEDTGVVPLDHQRALAWYIIAATHNFSDYQQSNPHPQAITARTIAQRRLPEVRLTMTDADVRAAERRVEELLGGGSAFDLLRLGRMRAEGDGLMKDNIEALKYLYLARGRGRGANLQAVSLIENLEELMIRSDVERAAELSDEWQPPLPETYEILTRADRDDAQRLTALQYQELRANLDELRDQFGEGGVVTDRALRALGFFYDEDEDGKWEQSERESAIRRFQTSLFIDRRPSDRNGQPLSEEERALARDVATGRLTDLQIVELMRQAANRGHDSSQHIYGVMLGRGIGVRKDGQAAIEMLMRSAEQNYALAHFSAGMFYVEGITAEQPLAPSVREACYHLRSALVLGYEPARRAQTTYCNFD